MLTNEENMFMWWYRSLSDLAKEQVMYRLTNKVELEQVAVDFAEWINA